MIWTRGRLTRLTSFRPEANGKIRYVKFIRHWSLIWRLQIRAAGMAYFYGVMDTRRIKFPQPPFTQTLYRSEPVEPGDTPMISRTNTPHPSDDDDDSSPVEQVNARDDRHSWTGSLPSLHTRRNKPHHGHHHSHHSLFHLPHHHLLREALNQSQEHHPVGVFESQHYMNIEKRLHHPNEAALEENCLRLLSDSVEGLLTEVGAAMDHIVEWLDRTNSDRLRLRPQNPLIVKDILVAHELVLKKLKDVMDQFLLEKR
jgi:Putative ER transporter, 6TM, N-terminal